LSYLREQYAPIDIAALACEERAAAARSRLALASEREFELQLARDVLLEALPLLRHERCVCERECTCVRERERECVCVCVCVCVFERERERERERMRECVCVCLLQLAYDVLLEVLPLRRHERCV